MTAQFSDDFNRSNGGLGSNWTSNGSAITISSNAAVSGTGAATYYDAYWDNNSLSSANSEYVKADITPPDAGWAAICLWTTTGTTNGYILIVDNTDVGIYEVTSGSIAGTPLAEVADGGPGVYLLGWGPNDALVCWKDDVQLFETSDTTFTPTRAGLLAYSDSASVAASFDDFEAGTLSNAVNISVVPTGWDSWEQPQWLAVHPITNELWRGRYNDSNDTIEFFYSSNVGQSWTQATSLTFPSRVNGSINDDYRNFAFNIDYQGVGYIAAMTAGATRTMTVYSTGNPAPDVATSMNSLSTWSTMISQAYSFGSAGDIPFSIKIAQSRFDRKALLVGMSDTNIGSSSSGRWLGASWDNSSPLATYTFLGWFGSANANVADAVRVDYDFEFYDGDPDTPGLFNVNINTSRQLRWGYRNGTTAANVFNAASYSPTWEGTIATGTVPSSTPQSTDHVAMATSGSTVLVAWVMDDPGEPEAVIGPSSSSFGSYFATVSLPTLNDGNVTSMRVMVDADGFWRIYVVTDNGNLWMVAVEGFGGAAITSTWQGLHFGNISSERNVLAVPSKPLAGGGSIPLGYVENQSGTNYHVLNFDNRQFSVPPLVTINSDIQGSTPFAAMRGRRVAVAPDGKTWIMVTDPYYGYVRLYWTEDGATFSQYGYNLVIGTSQPYSADIFADYAGRIWFTYNNGTTTSTYVIDDPEATYTTLPTGLYNYPGNAISTVVFADPDEAGYYIIARLVQYYNNTIAYLCTARYSDAHVFVSGSAQAVSWTGLQGTTDIELDFQHTGDGVTATSTPHLYVMYRRDAVATRMEILEYDGADPQRYPTASTTQVDFDTTDMGPGDRISGYWDGSRIVVAYTDNTSHSEIQVAEYSGSVTPRTPPTLSDGLLDTTGNGLWISYDAAQNIILSASGATSQDVWVTIYDRADDSWSSWTNVPATLYTSGSYYYKAFSAPRRINTQRNVLPVAWLQGTTPPYSIVYYEQSIDTPPDTPVINSPVTGNADTGEVLVFNWTFSDTNANDYQKAFALKRVIGGSTTYWNATSESWSGSEVKNLTTFSTTFLPASWASPSATTQDFSVKVWDSTDLESDYSTAVTITPSTRHDPTITAPTPGLSFPPTDTTITVNWTVTSQSQYRIWFSSIETGQLLHDTGWVVNSGTRSYGIPVTLDQESNYFIQLQTIGGTGSPSYSFPSQVQEVTIYVRRGYVDPGEPDRADVIVQPRTKVIRYADIYESDGTTVWKLRVPITTGSVSMQGPILRRSFTLELSNTQGENHAGEFDLDPDGGLWYDKIVKLYRGVEYKGTEYVWPLGVFHIDTISDLHWPQTVSLSGRDRYKVLENSKFAAPTQFSAEYDVWAVVRAIAINGGITEMSLPAEIIPLDVDVLFEQNTSRADAIAQLVEGIGYTTHFDASGVFIAQPLPDPYTEAPEFTFLTGHSGASQDSATEERPSVRFDNSTGDNLNYLKFPSYTSDDDASADCRVKFTRPSASVTSGQQRIANGGFQIAPYGSGDIYVDFAASDLSFPSVYVVSSIVDEYAAPGEVLDVKATWDADTDTLKIFLREDTGISVASEASWTEVAAAVHTGKEIRVTTFDPRIAWGSSSADYTGTIYEWRQTLGSRVMSLTASDISRASGSSFTADSCGLTVTVNGTVKFNQPRSVAEETATVGNMVSWSRRASDSELYNRVIIIGEASSGLAVYGDAKNEDPTSPTRIERIGERTMIKTLNTITTTAQAQDVAEQFLTVAALEQFEIDVSSIVVPWLEGGDIIEVLTEADAAMDYQPTRFMLSNITIPLGLGAMSISGRRLAIVR